MDRNGCEDQYGVKKKDGRTGQINLESVDVSQDWPQFRGPNRDGVVAALPDRLPHLERDLIWSAQLSSSGVGGLAIADGRVVVGGRDASDGSDQFQAYDIKSGKLDWAYEYQAPSALDYGNSPRATPAFSSGVWVTLGATGRLSGLDAQTGLPLWSIELVELVDDEFPTWGFSASPLIVGDRVYLQAGKATSLVAIDLFSGKTVAAFSGPQHVYASMISFQFADQQVVAGLDAERYFVRRVRDGRVLWSMPPEISGDFGVPSPVLASRGLLFVSENNGVQLFHRTEKGFAPKLSAVNDRLIPDSHTPVAIGGHLIVASNGLHCLAIDDGLAEKWSTAESLITGYASIIASPNRALVTTESGKLLLFDTAQGGELLDQVDLSSRKMRLLSHPAISSNRLLIRVGSELRCYQLRI